MKIVKYILIIATSLFLSLHSFSQASYVKYHNTSETAYFGSVPVTTSDYSYSDGQGNYISIRETTHVPVVYYNNPRGTWVFGGYGDLPHGAVVKTYLKGRPVFYCRVMSSRGMLYGEYMPDHGCVIQQYPRYPYISFQILIK